MGQPQDLTEGRASFPLPLSSSVVGWLLWGPRWGSSSLGLTWLFVHVLMERASLSHCPSKVLSFSDWPDLGQMFPLDQSWLLEGLHVPHSGAAGMRKGADRWGDPYTHPGPGPAPSLLSPCWPQPSPTPATILPLPAPGIMSMWPIPSCLCLKLSLPISTQDIPPEPHWVPETTERTEPNVCDVFLHVNTPPIKFNV